LPVHVVGLQIKVALGEGELEGVEREACLEVAPLLAVQLDPCVAESAASSVASGEELRELDVLVLLQTRVAIVSS